jgi:phosphotransferase system  glucose/maltose/N-acetylglucosamine-specific IIC component
MDSKKSINLIFLVFFVFLVHLFLYYFIPSYALYFKNIKYKDSDNKIETQELSNKKNVEIK